MVAVLGCDYSFSRPSIGSLQHFGVKFAARYYSFDGNGKNISGAEARMLMNAGIAPVSVYETTGQEALGGYNAGRSAAMAAAGQAVRAGQPEKTCIYYAVDFDAAPDQRRTVTDYFRGIRSVNGPYEVGCYGSYYVCDDQVRAFPGTFTWQTVAWSGGRIHQKANIYQDGTTFAGFPDLDRDYGYGTKIGSWLDKPGPNNDVPADSTLQEAKVSMTQLSPGWAIATVRGTDGQLYARFMNPDGSDKKDSNGKIYGWTPVRHVDGTPASVTLDGQDLWVFYRGSAGDVRFLMTVNIFEPSQWIDVSLGGLALAAPSATVGDGVISVMVEGLHGELYLNRRLPDKKTWSGWADLHGQAL